MEFRKREVKPPTAPANGTPFEPPFTYSDKDGKEIKIPMEQFRQLPQERKRYLLNQQMESLTRESKAKGDYPAKPAYSITVVIENCEPKDLGKVTAVKESCPAKMPLHEDYRLPINTYIARYFILNGDEQKKIEHHWLASIPSVQFKVEIENGVTEIHRRSIVDGKYGERMETSSGVPSQSPAGMGNMPVGMNMGGGGPLGPQGGPQSFNPRSDMHKLAKPCANCGKNRYAPPSAT
jgi:hypothetical protein|tara:strand:- start:1113 stop:1820 length:708 start_codon:yes stop_codon:yes gene_type:complete